MHGVYIGGWLNTLIPLRPLNCVPLTELGGWIVFSLKPDSSIMIEYFGLWGLHLARDCLSTWRLIFILVIELEVVQEANQRACHTDILFGHSSPTDRAIGTLSLWCWEQGWWSRCCMLTGTAALHKWAQKEWPTLPTQPRAQNPDSGEGPCRMKGLSECCSLQRGFFLTARRKGWIRRLLIMRVELAWPGVEALGGSWGIEALNWDLGSNPMMPPHSLVTSSNNNFCSHKIRLKIDPAS